MRHVLSAIALGAAATHALCHDRGTHRTTRTAWRWTDSPRYAAADTACTFPALAVDTLSGDAHPRSPRRPRRRRAAAHRRPPARAISVRGRGVSSSSSRGLIEQPGLRRLIT